MWVVGFLGRGRECAEGGAYEGSWDFRGWGGGGGYYLPADAN